MNLEQLICDNWHDKECLIRVEDLAEPDTSIIVAFRDLAVRFAHKTLGKAFGEDCIGGEVFRQFAEQLADVYLPLVLKSTLFCDHPLSFKGGMLYDL